MFRKPRRKVDRFFIHCSASDVPAHDSVEVIRQWHLARGFDDIGYHFFIHKDGRLSFGRDLEKMPASQKGHNYRTLSVCLHGFRVDKFTQAQFNTLQRLTLYTHKIYYGRVSFHGHQEVEPKACPILNYRHVLKLDRYGSLGLNSTPPRPHHKNTSATRLQYGDQGEAVRELQRLLGIKITGIYNKQTLAKVKDFKTQHGLYRSGIVTKKVWRLLREPPLAHAPSQNNGSLNYQKLPELRQGSRGSAVELLQRCLFLKVDGIYGPQVAKAVKRFKMQHGLYRSDIVNAYVWKLLLKQKSAYSH